jgi:protein phosphatase
MSENKTRTQLRLTAKTDVGRVREHNEDNYVVCPDVFKKEWFFSDAIIEPEEGTLLVIADGMGGLNAGEVASAIAIETIQNYFNQENRKKIESHEQVKEALNECINIAQTNMLSHAKEHPETSGMGTTIVIAFIKDNILHTAWVGDSRCYVIRKNTELYYATNDHSYVQELVNAKKITMEQAFYHPESNIITRSLGDNSNKTPKPDFCAYPIQSGDKILLCSDGLNGMLQDDAILKILHDTTNINEASNNLINAANEAGGHDNITLILSDIISVPNHQHPEKFKLRELELAVNFNQMDSGNPFQTLKPTIYPEDKNDDVVENDSSIKNIDSKKKTRRVLIVTLFIIIALIGVGMIIYQKLSNGKIELKKNSSVNTITDSVNTIKNTSSGDSTSIDTEPYKKSFVKLKEENVVKKKDTTQKALPLKATKSVENKENERVNLTPINDTINKD